MVLRGKGLHVVVPLAGERRNAAAWPEAKQFALNLCRKMAADKPSAYLVNMSKKLRTGRIYLDYLRNERTATAVAPLSPRAREGGNVSMPLDWDQVVSGLEPKTFTVRTAAALLSKDKPWADYASAASPLRAAMAKLGGLKFEVQHARSGFQYYTLPAACESPARLGGGR